MYERVDTRSIEISEPAIEVLSVQQSLFGRTFHHQITKCWRAFRFREGNRSCERSWPGTELDDNKDLGRTQSKPFFVEPTGKQRAEQRPHFGTGQEIAASTSTTGRRVEAR